MNILIRYANFLPSDLDFYHIEKTDQILSFLDSKKRNKEEDPDQRWITTWNDYLWRLKYFFRWLHNVNNNSNPEDWSTPEFARIKKKKTKRLSPYSDSDIFDRDQLLKIVKYEPHIRNKAILTLLWDLNARPHELTLIRIKNVRLKEKYGEGEIPEGKTGSGPILLTTSFPYVRDWLNEHPFKNEPNARLICNLGTGAPVKPTAILDMMKLLRKRIIRLLETNQIKDRKEIEELQFILKTKKFNPYCIRHSSITSDADYLPEYALKKKVRWSMNSKQGSRYIKRRMGNELKEKILTYNGIVTDSELKKQSSVINCPRCELANIIENKYCSKCSYPLKAEAYNEIKESEEIRMKNLEQKYQNDLKDLRKEMNDQFNQILSIIQQNPKLSYIK